MCHFVTMVLPPGTQIARVEPVLARYHRRFEIVENRHVARILEPGEIYFCPSPKHCECGTALGSMRQDPIGSNELNLASEIKKRRRQGWSEGKITRWREQLEKDHRKKAEQARRHQKSSGAPDNWLDIIRDLRTEAKLPYVGIMLHWYSGPLSERIDATRIDASAEELAAASLLYRMNEDVVYILS